MKGKMSNRKEYHKQYYLKNKIKWEKYSKNVHHSPLSKKRKTETTRLWRKKHPEKQKQYHLNSLKSWEGHIPKETSCEICSKKIFFNCGNKKIAIHFDHKDENVSIKIPPTTWLKKNKSTIENQEIWDLCSFGVLCSACNKILPTAKRKELMEKLIKYVFGENAYISYRKL